MPVPVEGILEMEAVSSKEQPKQRCSYRWPKQARDLVQDFVRLSQLPTSPVSGDPVRFRDLVSNLRAITGFPREVCIRFARQLGVKDRKPYRCWTSSDKQRLLDL